MLVSTANPFESEQTRVCDLLNRVWPNRDAVLERISLIPATHLPNILTSEQAQYACLIGMITHTGPNTFLHHIAFTDIDPQIAT